jgi:hypothetical protein
VDRARSNSERRADGLMPVSPAVEATGVAAAESTGAVAAVAVVVAVAAVADHNFPFRFDLETKRCVLFKLLFARKINQTTTFDILIY